MSSPPPRQDLLRAALIGLCLACLCGGLGVVVVGGWHLARPLPCVDLSANECALMRDTLRELARYQLLAGGALLLLAAGLLPALRRRRSAGSRPA